MYLFVNGFFQTFEKSTVTLLGSLGIYMKSQSRFITNIVVLKRYVSSVFDIV